MRTRSTTPSDRGCSRCASARSVLSPRQARASTAWRPRLSARFLGSIASSTWVCYACAAPLRALLGHVTNICQAHGPSLEQSSRILAASAQGSSPRSTGAEDVRRQSLNVFRMKMLGATVNAVASGSATLKVYHCVEGRGGRGRDSLPRPCARRRPPAVCYDDVCSRSSPVMSEPKAKFNTLHGVGDWVPTHLRLILHLAHLPRLPHPAQMKVLQYRRAPLRWAQVQSGNVRTRAGSWRFLLPLRTDFCRICQRANEPAHTCTYTTSSANSILYLRRGRSVV